MERERERVRRNHHKKNIMAYSSTTTTVPPLSPIRPSHPHHPDVAMRPRYTVRRPATVSCVSRGSEEEEEDIQSKPPLVRLALDNLDAQITWSPDHAHDVRARLVSVARNPLFASIMFAPRNTDDAGLARPEDIPVQIREAVARGEELPIIPGRFQDVDDAAHARYMHPYYEEERNKDYEEHALAQSFKRRVRLEEEEETD